MTRALLCDFYKGPAALRVGEIDTHPPGPGQIAVRVRACGVNASDWEILTGRPAYARVTAPFGDKGRVLGSDVMGVIEAVGPGVSGFAVGQRVLADTFGTFGGFAERVVAKAGLWVPVPDPVDDVNAAALPQSGTIALAGIADFVRPGMTVLINGAGGGSGPLAIQMALAGGARVSVVDRAEKLYALARYDTERTIDFQTEDFAARPERYDLVLDLFGTRPARRIARVLKPGGRYGLVGGPVPTLLGILVSGGLRSMISDKRIGILAVDMGPTRLPELLTRVENGSLSPLIGEVASLDRAPDALSRMGRGEIAGKLVITP